MYAATLSSHYTAFGLLQWVLRFEAPWPFHTGDPDIEVTVGEVATEFLGHIIPIKLKGGSFSGGSPQIWDVGITAQASCQGASYTAA